MGNFYKKIRVEKNLLMDGEMPVGGKWTYDEENRKKIPKNTLIPSLPSFKHSKHMSTNNFSYLPVLIGFKACEEDSSHIWTFLRPQN